MYVYTSLHTGMCMCIFHPPHTYTNTANSYPRCHMRAHGSGSVWISRYEVRQYFKCQVHHLLTTGVKEGPYACEKRGKDSVCVCVGCIRLGEGTWERVCVCTNIHRQKYRKTPNTPIPNHQSNKHMIQSATPNNTHTKAHTHTYKHTHQNI